MDKTKVAAELVKLAKELTADSASTLAKKWGEAAKKQMQEVWETTGIVEVIPDGLEVVEEEDDEAWESAKYPLVVQDKQGNKYGVEYSVPPLNVKLIPLKKK